MLLVYLELNAADAGDFFSAVASVMPKISNLRVETPAAEAPKRMRKTAVRPAGRSRALEALRELVSDNLVHSYEEGSAALVAAGLSATTISPALTQAIRKGFLIRLPNKTFSAKV